MLGNRLCGLHIGLAVRVFGVVIAGYAGVVDQEVDALGLILFDLLDQADDLILTCDIARKAMQTSKLMISICNEIFRSLLTLRFCQVPCCTCQLQSEGHLDDDL